MITISAHLLEGDVIAFGDIAGDFLNCGRDVRIQECLAIFHRKDDVIVGIVCAVVTFRDAHHFILSGKPTVSQTLP